MTHYWMRQIKIALLSSHRFSCPAYTTDHLVQAVLHSLPRHFIGRYVLEEGIATKFVGHIDFIESWIQNLIFYTRAYIYIYIIYIRYLGAIAFPIHATFLHHRGWDALHPNKSIVSHGTIYHYEVLWSISCERHDTEISQKPCFLKIQMILNNNLM